MTERRARRIREVLEAGQRLAARMLDDIEGLARDANLSPPMARRALARNLEREVSEVHLGSVLAWAGEELDEVAVVLSAGVLTSPLRAIALARAVGRRVVVHPSRRDPAFATLLVGELGAGSVRVGGRFVGDRFAGDELHVYGDGETVAELRGSVPARVRVRAHGHGFGVVWIERPDHAAARAIAEDVIDFDQRGCLSPRIVFVRAQAEELALALSSQLALLGAELPRAPLGDDERAAAVTYRDALAFAGVLHQGPSHMVGLADATAPLIVAPAGRHVHVVPASSPAQVARKLGALARFVTAVGTDVRRRDPELVAALGVPHARVAALGAMQTPPLDGPVDLRPDP